MDIVILKVIEYKGPLMVVILGVGKMIRYMILMAILLPGSRMLPLI